ncbi:MAG: flagellar brake protein [Clostridium sp.]|jgi:c-di-GMP-binding flagellar brake protein YcgR|nr:flagellar brake protein [Clostridium sp.]
MRINELKAGLKLEVQLYSLRDIRTDTLLVSEFEWAENDKIFFIAVPIHRGRLYPISIGTQMEVIFIMQDNLYSFMAKVIDRGIKSRISLLKMEALTEIKKIQRREFFRFECALPIGYRLVDTQKKDNSDDEHRKFTKTYTRDLSGGGVCIRLSEKVDYGAIIECELSLNDFNKIRFIGKIVRFTTYDTPVGMYKYEIGVFFEKISEKDRERVISFIFQEQRRLIKKG